MRKNIFPSEGDTIGNYLLGKELGRGGYGVVFRATQIRPVKREVALKILKTGLDAQEVMSRFEGERQALALMDHAGITKVFDAGLDSLERPYFVMELVEGVPITRFCDENKLGTRERLELVRRVCSAVQHAHQKGIIHRDLKPSNILVAAGLKGEEPTVKVIDFGIAKAVEEKFTEQTMVTALGQMLGTPLYMSPEQAGGMDQGIDTRSDIYSLGVVLYELLTGAPPIDSDKLKSASFSDMHRMICVETPPRPSLRIATKLTTVEEPGERQELRKRRSRLKTDLDWVVLKALEKDRERRYASAAAFADDLFRHLNHETVQATPPSRLYKLRKFVRRNPVGVAAAVVALTGIAVAFVAVVKERDATKKHNVVLEQNNELLTESKIQTASMASKMGNWEETLLMLDEALSYEKADQTSLRLEKIKALVAVNRVAEARNLLDLLAEQEVENPQEEARIKLWEAEFKMIRSGESSSKELVEESLALGLPPADAWYAKGLLASKAPEKLKCFRQCLEIDSFHHLSNVRMTLTLIFLGRFEDAESQLRFMSAAFPADDKTHDFLQALIASFRGDKERATALLKSQTEEDSSFDEKTASLLVDIIGSFGKAILESWDTGNTTGLKADMVKSIMLASRLNTIQGGKSSESSGNDVSQIVNIEELSGSFGAILRALPDIQKMNLPFSNTGLRAVERLEKAAANNPECLMHFYCGNVSLAYAARSKNAPYYHKLAEQSFEKASQLPSVVPGLPREAVYAHGMTCFVCFMDDRTNDSYKEKGLKLFRKRLSLGKPFKEHQLNFMFDFAFKTRDLELSQAIVEQQLELSPGNPKLLAKFAEVEFKNGNYFKSLKMAQMAEEKATDKAQLKMLAKLVEKNLQKIRQISEQK